MELVERVSAAYAWQRALGHEAVQDSLCCIVRDAEHPDVWDANHVSRRWLPHARPLRAWSRHTDQRDGQTTIFRGGVEKVEL